jgi:hypothetical protein
VVVAGALALLVTMAVLLIAISVFGSSVTGVPVTVRSPADSSQGAVPTPPAPRLEAQPGQDLAAYRDFERAKLSTYRWVDRQAGVVAIPIDQAMDVLAQQGLPARQAAGDVGERAPSMSSSGRVDEPYP